MNEEEMYPEEHERRKRNMRPDALVISEDVLRIMRIPRKDWTPELKANIQAHIDSAKHILFPGQELEKVPLVFHQQVADKVAALAAVFASTNDRKRVMLLSEIIGKSQICARTNYQFVRHFIRRGLYPILIESGIPVPKTWNITINVHVHSEPSGAGKESRTELFSRKYLEGIAEQTAAGTVKLFEGLVLYLYLEATGFPIKETLLRLINILIAKGEFEHYDEMKDILKEIKDSDPDMQAIDMRVLKGTEKG